MAIRANETTEHAAWRCPAESHAHAPRCKASLTAPSTSDRSAAASRATRESSWRSGAKPRRPRSDGACAARVPRATTTTPSSSRRSCRSRCPSTRCTGDARYSASRTSRPKGRRSSRPTTRARSRSTGRCSRSRCSRSTAATRGSSRPTWCSRSRSSATSSASPATRAPIVPRPSRCSAATSSSACSPRDSRGSAKGGSKRYQLQRFGRGGFVEVAMEVGAPIIPVAIIGAEEAFPMIADLKTLARRFGLPYFPITPTFPLLGPLGAIPLPSKWMIVFGEPIPTAPFGPESDRRHAARARDHRPDASGRSGALSRIPAEAPQRLRLKLRAEDCPKGRTRPAASCCLIDDSRPGPRAARPAHNTDSARRSFPMRRSILLVLASSLVLARRRPRRSG